jgi:ADP-ribose pyrophosphatase YjhB (NUDIX family)
MDKEHNRKFRLNARAIIYQDGQILAVQHKDKETGKATGYWSTPGGGVEHNEALLDGMKREIQEELAVEAKIGRLLFCVQWFSKKKNTEMLEFFYLIKNPTDFLFIDLKKTSHGVDEIAKISFVDPKEVKIMPDILSKLDLKDMCENLREVRTISYLE